METGLIRQYWRPGRVAVRLHIPVVTLCNMTSLSAFPKELRDIRKEYNLARHGKMV